MKREKIERKEAEKALKGQKEMNRIARKAAAEKALKEQKPQRRIGEVRCGAY